MYFGMLDQKTYDYTTTILQIPHWIAFLPILVIARPAGLGAAIVTLLDASALAKG